MTVTFQYKPLKLEALNTVNGFTNVVHKVTWQLVATANTNTVTSNFIHTVPFKHLETCTELTSLTDEQVMSWVLDEIHPSNLNAMRNGLAANLASIK